MSDAAIQLTTHSTCHSNKQGFQFELDSECGHKG
jgi:hypothetical protein